MSSTAQTADNRQERVNKLKRGFAYNLFYKQGVTVRTARLNDYYLAVAYTLRDRMQYLFVNSVEALLESESGTWIFTVTRSDEPAMGDRAYGVIHPEKVEVVERSLEEAVIDGELAENDLVVVGHSSRLMTLSRGLRVDITSALDAVNHRESMRRTEPATTVKEPGK